MATASQDKGAQDWHKWFWPPEWATWALVIGAGVTASIGIKTLRTIKIQTAAAKDSADAAKKSADALMLGDRAWVLVDRDDTKEKLQAPYLPTDEQLMVEKRWPHCVFFLKNFGKTPAKITALRFELEVSDNPNVPPDSPAYDNPESFNPYILPPDGSTPFEARMNSVERMEQECASVKEGVRYLWLCGIIKYVDVFERGPDSAHETRFCYVWEKRLGTPFWSMRGDADYNRFT